MSESKLIHLAGDLSHYHTDYLWKMPGSWEGYSYYSGPEFYEDIARMAARGIMDMLFFGDSGGTPEDYGGNHHTADIGRHEENAEPVAVLKSPRGASPGMP